jgi:starvation-inducible DNA-binding protein
VKANNAKIHMGGLKMAQQTVMNVTEVLNKQIANWSVLYVKLHHYHWFVKGTQFFTLHTKFEELYDEAAQYIDDLAERVLAIGGKPLSTMKDYLAQSTVKEAAGNESAEAMVKALAADFGAVIGELQEGIKAAEAAEDESTVDMFIGMHTALEKHVWMLKSFLG